MSHVRPQRFRGRAGPTHGVLLLVLALLCLPHGAPAVSARRPGLDRESRAIAERLYQQLEQARADRRDRALLELAFELVDRYARFPDNDRVLLLAAHSAWRLGDRSLARQLLGKLRDDWPESRLLGEAASLADKLDAKPELPLRIRAGAGADRAGPADAGALARPRGAGLPSEFAPAPAPLPPGCGAGGAGRSRADRGALSADRGERALGAAFAAGAELAAAHAGRDGWRPVRLRVVDTGGDPATAALAARRLVLGEGVVSLVGAVGAGPTAAVAVVADAWRCAFRDPRRRQPHSARFRPRRRPDRSDRSARCPSAGPSGGRRGAAIARGCALSGHAGRGARLRRVRDGSARDGRASGRRPSPARPTARSLRIRCGDSRGCGRRRSICRWRPPPRSGLSRGSWPFRSPACCWDRRAGTCRRRTGWPTCCRRTAVCAAEEAVWPRDWVEAFAVAWPRAAPADAGAGAERAGRQAYLAVRLVEEALADCGLTPTRETLATTLSARWLRLREAPVEAAEAVSGARTPREGRFVPYTAPVPDPGGRE